MKVFYSTLLILACSCFFSSPAQAMSFRCNSYVIDKGMHKVELMQKCGTPASASVRFEKRTVRVKQFNEPQTYPRMQNGTVVEVEKEIEVAVEEWVYNFGSSQFMQLVLIEEGRIRSISDLGYGR